MLAHCLIRRTCIGRALAAVIGLLLALLALSGCTKTDPPQFHLNRVELVRQDVPANYYESINDVLLAMFGSPDDPHVIDEMGLDPNKIQLASGPVRTEEGGESKRGLYRRHCGHCHGTSGDGMGPTAAILNPYPRDYRPGLFKFKSTERAAKPTSKDLERIVRQGIVGTAMPSFNLLPDDEIAALVEYVKYLSIRGQVELKLMEAIQELDVGAELPLTREMLVDTVLMPVVQSWQDADSQVISPPEKPQAELAQSVAKGREIFYGATANCVKCHGPSALGDGQTNDYDDWTKVPIVETLKNLADARDALDKRPEEIKKQRAEINADKGKSAEDKQTELAALDEEEKNLGPERQKLEEKERVLQHSALTPRNIIPRNLRLGVYRGGGRPLDLYRRIHSGINGTPMPGLGPASPGQQGQLKPEEIWSLVDYIRSLPYEPISKPPRQTVSVAGSRGQL